MKRNKIYGLFDWLESTLYSDGTKISTYSCRICKKEIRHHSSPKNLENHFATHKKQEQYAEYEDETFYEKFGSKTGKKSAELSPSQRRVTILNKKVSELEEILAKREKELIEKQMECANLQRNLRKNLVQKEDQPAELSSCMRQLTELKNKLSELEERLAKENVAQNEDQMHEEDGEVEYKEDLVVNLLYTPDHEVNYRTCIVKTAKSIGIECKVCPDKFEYKNLRSNVFDHYKKKHALEWAEMMEPDSESIKHIFKYNGDTFCRNCFGLLEGNVKSLMYEHIKLHQLSQHPSEWTIDLDDSGTVDQPAEHSSCMRQLTELKNKLSELEERLAKEEVAQNEDQMGFNALLLNNLTSEQLEVPGPGITPDIENLVDYLLDEPNGPNSTQWADRGDLNQF